MLDFIERLENLSLLSQNHQTSEHFNVEYERLLAEVMTILKGMKMLAAVQASWLQAEAEDADDGTMEQ